MELTFSNDYFAIFDNVLSKKDLEYVWTFVQEEEYCFYQQQKWKKVNRHLDGNHLEGSIYLSPDAPTHNNTVAFPTGKAIDIVTETIWSSIDKLSPWIGKKDKDWTFFTLVPFLYPLNTGVSWHDDYTKASGTLTIYLHPEWNIQWGGELIIADTSAKDAPPNFRPKYKEGKLCPVGPYIDNTKQNEIILNPGYGHYVLPKPNRLVVMVSGVNHMVKKVDPCAGDHMRSSAQAFFHSPNKPEGRY